ncbi:hypothetical protein DFH06DRAFT_1144152 [Mycena polygramma]|nr:hypothetical protein DFH06DRAFT_1144152 [Mycena polygramma]
MHGRRRSPTEGTERRTSPGTQWKGRGMSETVGGNQAELGPEGTDQGRTEGEVQAWAKVRDWTRHTVQARIERRRETEAQRARLRRIDRAERRRTKGGVGEEREEGSGEMRTYCTKAAVSGTSLYGSRPRPRVSARPEGEERRWSPKPDTGEREGCGCIGTPGVTIAGTSLYGSRPHPQGAELWSAEHREGGRLLRRAEAEGERESWSRTEARMPKTRDETRAASEATWGRGYREGMVARVRSTTKGA